MRLGITCIPLGISLYLGTKLLALIYQSDVQVIAVVYHRNVKWNHGIVVEILVQRASGVAIPSNLTY
ncbi:hypothetical protein G6F42_018225 [Rhizopus arrhizus]|nr:hypothetical protein G6F42_018225 [Rhizopus arrhizus]